jgi:AbrB family looped-hinge helix DNA binding protein
MEIATTRLSSRGQIVIPSELRVGFEEGDDFLVIRKGEDLILRKTSVISSLLANVDFNWEGATQLADENLLGRDWLSPEDEKSFAYLQNNESKET